MRIRRCFLSAAAALVLAAAVSGCAKPTEEPAPEPKIAPPAIGRAGVLRAGVDLTYPPFGGTDKGREAGIDVDLASALAAQLALELEIVQVSPSGIATALAEGDIDIALSAPLSDETIMSVALAGTYMSDGAAFFSREATGTELDVASLGDRRVAAQQGSWAYWQLEQELGEDAVIAYPTLREAIQALEDDQADVVAGDYAVGAYIARDFDSVRFSGVLGAPVMLGVAVHSENVELEQAIRAALDTLATDGTLDRIVETWIGTALPSAEATTAGGQ